MSCILFIDRLAPDASKTMGQAVNNAVSYGLGLMVGFFINGYLYEVVGVFNLFFISSVIALVAGIMFQIYQMLSRRLRY
jgi:PPP family 3-phenylpropionic acid transporter